jgi:hypothetical protein
MIRRMPTPRVLASGGVLALAALLAWTALVWAEATPSPGPTATCTIEAQQQSGEECLMCGVMQGDPAKCLKRLASRGYSRRCRGEGKVQWLELWCRPAKSGDGAPPTR